MLFSHVNLQLVHEINADYPNPKPYLQVFLNHLLWSISQEHIKVKNAPGSAVSDCRRRLKGDLWKDWKEHY